MRWDGNRESENIEDRRGQGGGSPIFGGRSIGIGTIVVALIGGWVLGINPLTLLGMLSGGGSPVAVQQPAPAGRAPADDTMARFVSTVLADTEDVWGDLFRKNGGNYQQPRLVLFRGTTQTACGTGQAAMGPFYCPADQKVYIDLGFYQTLKDQLGAPGDFAQAYVIAHEVGHHVQHLLGITDKVDSMRGRVSKAEQNQLSVRLELQADCLAGVWAHHAQNARQILGRCGRGDERRGEDRRRRLAARRRRCGRARQLHPWHECAASALVPERSAARRTQGLRHVQRPPTVTPDTPSCRRLSHISSA